MKKLSQVLKSHISGMPEAISLKFGMWSTEVGGSVHSTNRLVSSRQHRATEVQTFCFLSSCQYTYGCCAPASWAARHITVCLDMYNSAARWVMNDYGRLSSVTSMLNQLSWPLNSPDSPQIQGRRRRSGWSGLSRTNNLELNQL